MGSENPIVLVEENDADALALQTSLIGQGVTTRIQRLVCPADAKAYLQAATVGGGAANAMPAAVLLGLGTEARVGFDFVRWVRGQPELKNLVVIALGQAGQLREVQEAYASGANAYFVKGPDCAALIRTLQSAFGKDSARDTHPAFRSFTDLYRSGGGALNRRMGVRAPLLLVDDDERHTKLFIQGLDGLRVRNQLRRVTTVQEAIDYLQGSFPFVDRSVHPFPIVLFLDIRLEDSHKLLAWMEGHPGKRPAGIIALTSSNDMRPVIQAYHLGVHSFLQEPVKLEEFRDALIGAANIELFEEDGGFWIQPKQTG